MSHTPYYYAPGGKYVLFLDLLGFTAFVRSSFERKAIWYSSCCRTERVGPAVRHPRRGVNSSESRKQLDPPMKSMMLRLDTKEMFIELQRDIPIDAVVDLRGFGSFRPGAPIDSISRIHGQPVTVRRDHAGTYSGYQAGDFRIEAVGRPASQEPRR